MKPSDLTRVVERLRALGFKVLIRLGPVDRASRPMSVELEVKPRNFSVEEREAFAKFFAHRTARSCTLVSRAKNARLSSESAITAVLPNSCRITSASLCKERAE
jgi:hypothetical protein